MFRHHLNLAGVVRPRVTKPDRCFAIDKFCHLCQTKGHIQRACTSSRVKREYDGVRYKSPASKVRKMAAVSATEQREEGVSVREND